MLETAMPSDGISTVRRKVDLRAGSSHEDMNRRSCAGSKKVASVRCGPVAVL